MRRRSQKFRVPLHFVPFGPICFVAGPSPEGFGKRRTGEFQRRPNGRGHSPMPSAWEGSVFRATSSRSHERCLRVGAVQGPMSTSVRLKYGMRINVLIIAVLRVPEHIRRVNGLPSSHAVITPGCKSDVLLSRQGHFTDRHWIPAFAGMADVLWRGHDVPGRVGLLSR